MKRFLCLMLSVMLITALTACGAKEEKPVAKDNNGVEQNAGEKDKVEEKKENVTIRFSWWGGESRHEATLRVIEAFQDKYPHITVEPEYGAWDGHYEKMATQLIGGKEADVMQLNFNWFSIFSPTGDGFYDLGTLNSIDLSKFNSDLVDVLTTNGKVNGIPASVGGRCYYINETPFTQLGIEIPTTWDGLFEAGNKFKAELGEGYYPLGNISTSDSAALMMFSYLMQLTGKNIVTDDNKLAYTEEELTKGFEFIEQLLSNHVIPYADKDSAAKDAKNPNWIEGRYAGVFEWNSSIAKYVETLNPDSNPNVVLAPYFTLDGQKHTGATNKISMGFGVSKHTKHPEEAALLIDFMYNDPVAIDILKLERGVPVHEVAAARLEETGALEGLGFEGHLLVEEVAGFAFHPYYEDAEVKPTYIQPIEEFLYGNLTTPNEAAKKILANFDTAMYEAMNR